VPCISWAPAVAAAAAVAPASTVPPARVEELEAQWRALEARAPPKVRGRPSDEAIAALQAHKVEARRFASELCDDAETALLAELQRAKKDATERGQPRAK